MRSSMLKQWKKSLAFMLSMTLLLGMGLIVSSETKAAELSEGTYEDSTTGVRYVPYSNDEGCRLGEAPIYSKANENYGYLFGGWFRKTSDEKYDPIDHADEKTTAGDTVYAKFVPSYVLGVRCQNSQGTKADSESANLRIVSSLDSRNYQKVGFELLKIIKKSDGSIESQEVMGSVGGQETTTTYGKLRVYGEGSKYRDYAAQDIFGDASKYLTTWKITGIPAAAFGAIIGIRPYWVTMDGTTVHGLTKYAHVEDGYMQYLNVPINLNGAQGVAAGLLRVDYGTNLTFVDAEYGQVFQEMNWKVDEATGTITCIGNLEDMGANAKADNIFVNLRFQAKSGSVPTEFDVTGESFSDVDENLLDSYDVWKVKAAIVGAASAE